MNLSLAFTRTLFTVLSLFFMTTYMISGPGGYSAANLLIGLALGGTLALLLAGFDLLFKRFNLRAFNISIIGLLIGYLMGQALVLVLSAVLDISSASIHLEPQRLEVIQIALFLFGLYLGTLMTIRASDELYMSIPFVRFNSTTQKKKDLILDHSALCDARIIDLAACGILDHHLVIPRFLVKELHIQAESLDEAMRNKAKRSLEIVKKLEAIPGLEVRFNDTDFHEIKDLNNKMIRLTRLLDANVLTADISRLQTAIVEGVRFINIHSLSTALKPMMQAGEIIKIKIQRYGKEPRQGVGYLDDGTMVVVNGGGEYIGEIIEAKVLSVKHTTSGRMIFCNAQDEEGGYYSYDDEGQ